MRKDDFGSHRPDKVQRTKPSGSVPPRTVEQIRKQSSTAVWDELDRALDHSIVKRPRPLRQTASAAALIASVVFLIIVVVGILLV